MTPIYFVCAQLSTYVHAGNVHQDGSVRFFNDDYGQPELRAFFRATEGREVHVCITKPLGHQEIQVPSITGRLVGLSEMANSVFTEFRNGLTIKEGA